MVIFCWCGHIDKYHSTGTPNKCTKCDTCEYYRPKGNFQSFSNKPILSKFDGTCKVCQKKITAKKHKIIKSKNMWIHESCKI
jgi:hypothetical protein